MNERFQISQVIREYVTKDTKIDVVVAVHEHVSEPGHVFETGRESCVEPAVPVHQVEQFAIGPRLAEAPVRDDVRRHVESGLNGDLQCVLYKASRTSVSMAEGLASRRKSDTHDSMSASFLATSAGSVIETARVALDTG